MKKSLKEIGRQRINHIRKRIRKKPLGVRAIKCVEKVRQKTLRKNPITCTAIKWVEKAFERHHPECETLPQLELDTA